MAQASNNDARPLSGLIKKTSASTASRLGDSPGPVFDPASPRFKPFRRVCSIQVESNKLGFQNNQTTNLFEGTQTMATDAKFGHMVFFKLKDNSDESKQAMIAACEKCLSTHPGTAHFSVGILADTERDVNDRDFDISLHLVFDSREAHDQYQVADLHNQFIDENKDNWSNVRVFDSVVA